MIETPQWQYPSSRILVFAKAPRAGEVKTRLAGTIGADRATQVYSEWLETLVTQLDRARLAPLQLWVSPDARHPLFRRLAKKSGIELHNQPGGDLGQRMHEVMLRTLARCDSAVLIGSDCPVMQPDYVRRALAVMDAGVDTVLGPVEDGGYVLLGLRAAVSALFTDVPWSTQRVLQVTRQRLLDAGGGWAELETLWDVDSVADYRRWQLLQSARRCGGQNGINQEVQAS